MGRKRRKRRLAEELAEEGLGERWRDEVQGDLLDDAPSEAPEDEPDQPDEPDEPDEPAHPSPAPPHLVLAGDRLARARDLVRSGRPEEAVEVYREIIRELPSHPKARNNLGVLYDEMGHHELALEHLEAARNLDPNNVEILTNLGSVLAALRRFEEAEGELRKAQRLEPESVAVRAGLGVLAYRRGLYARAEAELGWVCEQDSEHGPAHYYRGEALLRLGRVDEAMETMGRALELQPGNARAFYAMGILYDKKNLSEEAAVMYRKARELSQT